MSSTRRGLVLPILMAVLVAACAGPASQNVGRDAAQPAGRTDPKRIVGIVIGEHPALISKFERALQGAEALEAAVAAGLSIKDQHGNLVPQLAEAVPTLDNGLWKLFPDGRMETTWNLRKDAVWHDGAPFTTDDLVFTATVGHADVVSNFRQNGAALIESMEASGPHTFTARWKSPFIEADKLFASDLEGTSILFPLPKHLLERPFLENRDGFVQLPYWSEEFVGTGPYKLKEWTRGVRTILVANDRYVLGRPKIDEVEVRFIADDNTAVANLLSGAVDMTLGRGVSIEQAADAAAMWPQGRVENIGLRSRFALYPQFVNPSPAVIGTSAPFRKALMHAMDRQTMADTLQRGAVPVAHTYMGPDSPMYPQIESQIVKYEYDPRRATQMIESLGFARGGDGVYSDAGQRLAVEIRATPGDLYDKIMEAVRDNWQTVGVATETVSIPRQRQSDLEYRATRPGFELTRRGTNLTNLSSFHGRESPAAESRWIGSNVPRYQNTELDALIDRYFVTVPMLERTQVAGQIMRHISDQLNMMHVFYDSEPALISNRVLEARGRGSESTQTWNIHLWDVR
jgi:peptide/nickel transport system substrate-binding protein